MSEWKNGLPPVGEVVAMFDWAHSGAWFEVEVIAVHNKKGAVGWCESTGNFYSTDNPDYVEPIKSEAERKRDEAVESLSHVIAEYFGYLNEKKDWDMAVWLHDAGYRKVNELTDERITEKSESHIGERYFEHYSCFRDGAKWARSQIMGEES